MISLDRRRFVITGASSGIGRQVAITLSKYGSQVVLAGRNQSRLEETFSQLNGTGHFLIAGDLRDSETTIKLIQEAARGGEKLDGFVHCAGVASVRPIRLVSSESYRELSEINVGAAFNLLKAFRARNIRSDVASVVLVSSVAGFLGLSGQTEYCATKAALVGLAKSAAVELAKENIRVNTVAPGLVKSEMLEGAFSSLTDEQVAEITAKHPLGLGRTQHVADAVAFLLSDLSSWITGTTIHVDGGYLARG